MTSPHDLTVSGINIKIWQEWSPRLEDYWASWNHKYRHRVVEHVSKHTPLKGDVLEVGCAVGINLYLLSLQRPDLTLIGFEANGQARNLAAILVPSLITGPALTSHDDLPQVDTIFTTFTLAYTDPKLIVPALRSLSDKAKTLVLAEPTFMEEAYKGGIITGFPCESYRYPYPTLLRDLGMDVGVDVIDPTSEKINVITIATHGD